MKKILAFVQSSEYTVAQCENVSHSDHVQSIPYFIGYLLYMNSIKCFFVCLDWFFTSKSTNFQSFQDGSSRVKPEDKVSCSRTQCSASGEAQTRNPSIQSQALYHWATALLHNLCDSYTIRLNTHCTFDFKLFMSFSECFCSFKWITNVCLWG